MNSLKGYPFFFAILIIGTVIRFLGFPDLQYHHDELSALLRTSFTSFDALIDGGVKVDGHPAFTQIFLWCWTTLVGFSPYAVKLPFLMAGVASIYLVFRSAELLFSRHVAWVSSSLFAVMQYSIIFSQYARPYSFGLFFLLLVFYALIQFERSSNRGYLILYAISSALAAYTHYFAILQVVIVSMLWWLVKLNKSQRLQLVVAALVAFIVWSPHLSITLHHLSLKGVGQWLQPPEDDYWLQWLSFSFHYSWIFSLPIILVFLASAARLQKNRALLLDQSLLVGCMIIPFLIGFIYSHSISAVMHFGSLYFAFPFLVYWSGSLVYRFEQSLSKLIATWVLIFGPFTLLLERSHLSLNTVTEFQDAAEWLQDTRQEANVAALFDLRPDAVSMMNENSITDFSEVKLFEDYDGLGEVMFDLQRFDAEYLMVLTTAASPPELLAAALHYFPKVVELHCYQTSACYLLSKEKSVIEAELAEQLMNQRMKRREYSDVLEAAFGQQNEFANLMVSASYEGAAPPETQLVMDITKDNSSIFWRALPLSDFEVMGNEHKAFIAIDTRDLSKEKSNDLLLKCYIWNPSKEELYLKSIEAALMPSNPLRYGLFENFDYPKSIKIDGRVAKKVLYFEPENKN